MRMLSFLIGMFIGGFFGIIIMALLIARKTEDERNED